MKTTMPTTEMVKLRAAQLRRAELQMPFRTFYLSFASKSGFLGAVIVEAHGIVTALDRVNALGINPGGEVACAPCPRPVLPELRNRLLSREELESAFGETRKMFQ